jgi:hypothetical protein
MRVRHRGVVAAFTTTMLVAAVAATSIGHCSLGAGIRH